jgi:hypothetical protein
MSNVPRRAASAPPWWLDSCESASSIVLLQKAMLQAAVLKNSVVHRQALLIAKSDALP